MEFPENLGFIWNNITQEWESPIGDLKILIWKNLNSDGWTIAYEDKEEFIYKIKSGSEEDIKRGLKIIIRDIKINDILN